VGIWPPYPITRVHNLERVALFVSHVEISQTMVPAPHHHALGTVGKPTMRKRGPIHQGGFVMFRFNSVGVYDY